MGGLITLVLGGLIYRDILRRERSKPCDARFGASTSERRGQP
jgi:hypothetical protein